MGFNFNPVYDNDWQGLNVMLEQLANTQTATEAATDKSGPAIAQVTKDEVTQVVEDEGV